MTTSAKMRAVISGAAAVGAVAGLILIERVLVRTGPQAHPVVTVPAGLSLAAVAAIAAAWPGSRKALAPITMVLASVLLISAVLHPTHAAPREAFWILAGQAVLLLLLFLLLRWATRRGAVVGGALVAVAGTLTLLRVTAPATTLEAVGVVCTWAFVAAAPAGLGAYLRRMEARRARMLVAARRAQRLELAHDLHDFVAHDVTGMVVQAQAARVVAPASPDEAIAALRGIEQAGLHALDSLDRTVHTLRDLPANGGEPALAPAAANAAEDSARMLRLEEIFPLVGRFSTTDQVPVLLQVDPFAETNLAPAVASTAYRVVREALTNVRRHAPNSTRVEVRIARRDDDGDATIEISITNTIEEPGRSEHLTLRRENRRDGLGLAGLAERVIVLGGRFTAGPLAENAAMGWRVTAVLPLREAGRP